METSEDVNIFIPMLIAVMISRFVASLFGVGIYKEAIKLKSMPIITKRIKDHSNRWQARDIMKFPVVSFNTVETVAKLY